MSKNRGLFKLTADHLYIANDGHSFGRRGVLALCRPYLSDKSDLISDSCKKVPDEHWVNAICGHRLDLYVKDETRLESDTNAEKEMARDYSDRWLFEVLQNIDDAIGPKNVSRFIGTKGLGFLSILEIAENPAVFSGHFNFQFNKKKTKEALLERGVDETLADLAPNFEVPWPANYDSEVTEIMKDGYATVLRFKLKANGHEDVVEKLKDFDHHFLLFSQHLRSILLSIDKTPDVDKFSKEISIAGKCAPGDDRKSKTQLKIEISEQGQKLKPQKWIKWQRNWESSEKNGKRSSCMFCLPLDGKHCVPFEGKAKIFNFYPTDEPSEIQGLLHVTFHLSPNRKKFQPGDSEEDKRLIEGTRKLIIEDVINDDVINNKLVPPETIIKCFSSLNKYAGDIDSDYEKHSDTKSEPLKQIQNTLINSIKETSFLPTFGGGFASINDAIVWKHDLLDCLNDTLEIQNKNFISKNLKSEFLILRDRYGCDDLDFNGLVEVFADYNIKNKTEPERALICATLKEYYNLNPLGDKIIEKFFSIPFIEDKKNNILSLGEDFFCTKKNIILPSFIKARYLSENSDDHLNEYFFSDDIDQETWLEEAIKTRLITSKKDLIALKIKEKTEQSDDSFWSTNGFETLAYLLEFFIKSEKDFSEVIESFKEHIRVPSMGSTKWSKAENTYFSKNWPSKKYLSNWFENHKKHDEFLISNFNIVRKKTNFDKLSTSKIDNKKIDAKAQLTDFLFQLGVRKTPKLRKVENLYDWRKLGKTEYSDYIDDMNPQSYSVYSDWQFQGLGDFFQDQTKEEGITHAFIMIKDSMSEKYKSGHKKRTNVTVIKHPKYENYANFQLKNMKWLKLKSSPLRLDGLYSPDECYYVERSPDNKIFPKILKYDLEKYDLEKFIEDFCIKKEFSPLLDTWEDWLEKIPNGYEKLYEKIKNKSESTEKLSVLNTQVKNFYEELLRDQNFSKINFNNYKLPVLLSQNNETTFQFLPSENVIWNDTSIDDKDYNKHLNDALNNLVDVPSDKLGAFIIGKLNINKQGKLTNDTITLPFKLLDITSNHKPLKNDLENVAFSFLESYWELLSALDKKFGGKKSRKFSDFKSSLTICEHIDVIISLKSGGKSHSLQLYYYKEEDGKTYISNDDEKFNLAKHISNEFPNCPKGISFVRMLFLANNDKKKIKEILESENLDPNLADLYKKPEEEEPPTETEEPPTETEEPPTETEEPPTETEEQPTRTEKPPTGIIRDISKGGSSRHPALDRPRRWPLRGPSRGPYPLITEEGRVVKIRKGQDIFRANLMNFWKESCAVTGVKNPKLLRASHIKPWAKSSNQERLDVYNGLLLVATIDAAFGVGLISFRDDGHIMISEELLKEDRVSSIIATNMRISKITNEMEEYLAWHRYNKFLP